jgi:hypothetical protein
VLKSFAALHNGNCFRIAQVIIVFTGAIALLRIWRDSIATTFKKAASCLAALLAAERKACGFARCEIMFLAILRFVPLVARNATNVLFLPLAGPATLSFGLPYRRCNTRKRPQGTVTRAKIDSW